MYVRNLTLYRLIIAAEDKRGVCLLLALNANSREMSRIYIEESDNESTHARTHARIGMIELEGEPRDNRTRHDDRRIPDCTLV